MRRGRGTTHRESTALNHPTREAQHFKQMLGRSLNRFRIERKTEVLLRRGFPERRPGSTTRMIFREVQKIRIRGKSIDTLRLERFRYGDIHNARSTGSEPARER